MKAFLCISGLLVVAMIAIMLRLHQGTQASHAAEQGPAATDVLQSIIPKDVAEEDAPDPRFPRGYNFALASNGAKAGGGLRPELLIDGNSTTYDGGNGYAYTHWRNKPPESLLVELKQPSEINCIRFLLWDLEENRYYRYKLEVCASNQPDGKWTTVADKTGEEEECRSWQVIGFPKQTVQSIRLTGTFCSVNSSFHVVELQALMAPKNGFPPELKKSPANETAPRENLEF